VQLLEHVQNHLVEVLDLVADGQIERVEAGPDQVHLRPAELQRAGNVFEEIADRSGELRLIGDDFVRQRFSSAEERKLLGHLRLCGAAEQVRYHHIRLTRLGAAGLPSGHSRLRLLKWTGQVSVG
jgi:hypothetical protein